jgi:hypothetical protein
VWSGSRRLKNPSWSHRLPVRATLKLELYNPSSFSLIVSYRKRSSFRALEPTPTNPPVLSAPVFGFCGRPLASRSPQQMPLIPILPLVALGRCADIASFLQPSLVVRGSCGSFLLPI